MSFDITSGTGGIRALAYLWPRSTWSEPVSERSGGTQSGATRELRQTVGWRFEPATEIVDRRSVEGRKLANVTDINVIAVDVGSLLNIGWWRDSPSQDPTSGRDLDSLVDAVTSDLLAGAAVALGFEAPLFVPVPSTQAELNRQRVGEKGRPWCAGAGTGALALGIQQSTYVFSALAQRLRPRVTFDPAALLNGEADLLVWEAFVSGKAKNRAALHPHIDDARLAVREFRSRLSTGTVASDINESTVLNLVAAGLIASGLASDWQLLRTACVVVAPPPLGVGGSAGESQ